MKLCILIATKDICDLDVSPSNNFFLVFLLDPALTDFLY